MDIQPIQSLLSFEPYDLKLKRCGCYIRNPLIIDNVKPRTHVAMPLKHIDYDIQVTNGLVSTTLQQTYLNPTQKFLQIDFSFPIDPKSCIYKFVAEFGNKRIEGIVKQKQQAKKQYQQAIKQGKQAVYAEIDPNSKDIINMQIGNLGPGQEVKISISYLQQLNVEQNTFYQLHLPSTISPRYMNNNQGKQYKNDIQKVKGEYTWTFKISIFTSQKLVYYMSPSHNLNLISQNETQTQTILCLPNQQKPNMDLFLLFTVENFHLPNYVFGRTDCSSTAMLSFIPKFCQLSLDDAMKASMIKKELETDMSAAKGQYIFLLDRSGSMGGSRIQKAKQALILFLQSLPQDTYFNVVSFGNAYDFMFKQSVKYNNENLKTAVQKIKKMGADMGGTQIFAALQNILKNKVIDGYPKQIFLLTDGGVSNTEGVISLVGQQVKYSRCHSIGIGNGCSEALIKGCAQKGKGKFIFIQDSENPSQKIIGLLQQTLTPVIDHVTLKYDKNLVESIVPNPQSLPYILKNEVVNFYITFKGQLDKNTSFSFGYKDSVNKVPFETNIEVDPESPNISFVDKMAHNKIIKNLQFAAKQNKPIQEMMYYVKVVDKKQQAIKHSVKYQILSEYTAFICVNKQLVDGKFQEIKQKGTQKISVQSYDPSDLLDYNKNNKQINPSFDKLMLCSAPLKKSKCAPKMAMRAAQSKSSGNFLGNVVSSVTSFFSKKLQSNSPPPMMMQRCMAPQSKSMAYSSYDSVPMRQSGDRKRSSKIQQAKKSLQQVKQKKQQRKIVPVQQKMCSMKQEQQQCEANDFDFFAMDECCIPKNKCDMLCDMQQQVQKKKQKSKKRKSSPIQKDKQSSTKSVKSALTIQQVIKQQNVDGSFASQDLLKSIYSNPNEVLQLIKTRNVSKQAAITYIVAKWIQKYHPQKQYALIIKKALSFIKKSFKLEYLQFLNQFVN